MVMVILSYNYCQFDGDIWLQVIGYGTGVANAAEVANLYLTAMEERQLSVNLAGLIFFTRYIDDGFGVWSGTEATLRTLLSRLYEGSGLKITLEISTEFVVFLDMTVFVDAHRLVTKCYQKPSNAYLYLPYSSEHPAHVWHAFLRGELIRYVKRCTFFSDYNDMVSLFAGRLRRRGYPQRAMRASFKTVSWALRESYLAIKPKSDVRPNLMTFVTTYSKRLYDSAVPHAFKENLELLRKLPHFRDVQFIMSVPAALWDIFPTSTISCFFGSPFSRPSSIAPQQLLASWSARATSWTNVNESVSLRTFSLSVLVSGLPCIIR